jgi:RNA polymerase sigma-70 factor, ECF subfamily
MSSELDFEALVDRFYAPLYRFALSLTHDNNDACDLTQETFLVWATKGQQLKDATKVKPWLFTTLHRQFLQRQRNITRFPHDELSAVEENLLSVEATVVARLDGQAVVAALAGVDGVFRAPVSLFYLEEYSYNEIADILEIPLGTVKSRIARGIGQLKAALAPNLAQTPRSGHYE